MIGKVLIANRGEIALRIHRACKEMGLATVAIHSEIDGDAMHVRLADESVCIGAAPAQHSYLNIPAIISAAEITSADAIHPGYGFLSENAKFARIVQAHGMIFIGPDPNHIEIMGDKIAAKRAMQRAGVPVVPGSEKALTGLKQAHEAASEIGYPVLIKASAGGGGHGMKVARAPNELDMAFRTARSEAKSAFGNDSVYIEKFLDRPRHIEIQVLADKYGNVVHLGERDCSLQRRHQKILEEAPCPVLSRKASRSIATKVCDAVRDLGYLGAGTVEFLYENGQFYFIEMNTRLQVEHPVTEMITRLDLVHEQIRVAAGERLGLEQKNIKMYGHAIECRINAENPVSFAPSPGRITGFHPPGGLGVRVDSAIYTGYCVPPHYDSLIGKLIVHGLTREECLMRLRRALDEFVVEGIDTTLGLHRQLTQDPGFASGEYDIHWLQAWLAEGNRQP